MNKSILVLSYYANMPGACQAEWVDDRINAFINKGYKITLISSIGTFKHSNLNIKHVRVPTISPHGFLNEFDEICNRKIKYEPFIKFLLNLYYYIAIVIYKILVFFHLKSGEGRWTWFISSFITSIFLYKKYSFIYTTGGPASPHLTGIVFSKLTGIRHLAELQDPLSGDDIGRNKFSGFGLKIIEKFITQNADITLYCTKNAMIDARKKYFRNADKIFYVYPGSAIKQSKNIDVDKNTINITYLGSLYQTRNLDTVMSAIKILISENIQILGKLEINLYGNINKDIKIRIQNFEPKIINIHGLVSREVAMEKANSSDILLLIQNSDDRSTVTIPFKTYDYLKSGKLILGLIYKNQELKQILINHGHLACEVNDVFAIKNILSDLILHKFDKTKYDIKESNITPDFAAAKMLELINEK
jgi:hypothetical protein